MKRMLSAQLQLALLLHAPCGLGSSCYFPCLDRASLVPCILLYSLWGQFWVAYHHIGALWKRYPTLVILALPRIVMNSMIDSYLYICIFFACTILYRGDLSSCIVCHQESTGSEMAKCTVWKTISRRWFCEWPFSRLVTETSFLLGWLRL